MRYVRGRRLTEAARALASGAPDILSVALEAGYGSHEAFTRAFRDAFGTTPEAVRAARTTATLALVEPLKMTDTPLPTLSPPRFETGKPLLLAGLSERYDDASVAGIAALWQRVQPHLGQVPGQVGRTAYGVCYNADDEGGFDYLAGVEVADFAALPAELARLRVPAQRYAVFHHAGHIAAIRGVFKAIWTHWLPQSGHALADAPVIERYTEAFDGRTGTGGFEIWIPLKP